MNKSADVFISHSNIKAATGICKYLESRGISCWMAPRDTDNRSGNDFGESILRGIKSAKILLIIFDERANRSLHVKNEIVSALNYKLSILPVKIDNTPPSDPIELHLGAVHWFDASKGKPGNHFPGLYATCCNLLEMEKIAVGTDRRRRVPLNKSLIWAIVSFIVVCLALVLLANWINGNVARRLKEKKIIAALMECDDGAGKPLYFKFVPAIKALSDSVHAPGLLYNNEKDGNMYIHYLKLSPATKMRFVTLNSFYVSPYKINNLEWRAVTGQNAPPRTRLCDTCPLLLADLEQIQYFIETLNEKTGKRFRLATKMEQEYMDSLGIGVRNRKRYDNTIVSKGERILDLGFRLCTDEPIQELFDGPWSLEGGMLPPRRMDTMRIKADTLYHWLRYDSIKNELWRQH